MPTKRRKVPLRHIAAVVVGNALEFYNFVTFAFFAIYIGRTFFPSDDPTMSLLPALATFGVGFITRPIGGIVIGAMGDRIGRKPAMIFSFTLMGAAMVGLALTPSYATIGIAAPILVIVFRLVQGFALGGEVGPTMAFLIEAAPPERRGFYASLQYATQDFASMFAGLVGVVLANVLDAQALQDWGWRAALLIGALIIPVGLWLRHSLPETLHAADDAALAPDATAGKLTLRAKLAPYTLLIVLCLIMLASATIGNYVGSYMVTYSIDTLHMPANIAFGTIIVAAGANVLFEPVSGWLSDLYGRKPVMIVPGVLLLLSIFPAFWAIEHYRTAWVLYGCLFELATLFAFSTTPIITMLTETLPASVRSGAVSTIYAFAIGIFGGSTQFMLAWIIRTTGNPLAPAWYWTIALAIGLCAMLFTRESAPVKTGRKTLG